MTSQIMDWDQIAALLKGRLVIIQRGEPRPVVRKALLNEWAKTCHEFIEIFQTKDPNFDVDRFLARCGWSLTMKEPT